MTRPLEEDKDTGRRYLPQGFPELKDKGRKVVYHKDLIGGGQGRRKEPYQRVPSPEGQSPQVFLPSREQEQEVSTSLYDRTREGKRHLWVLHLYRGLKDTLP